MGSDRDLAAALVRRVRALTGRRCVWCGRRLLKRDQVCREHEDVEAAWHEAELEKHPSGADG